MDEQNFGTPEPPTQPAAHDPADAPRRIQGVRITMLISGIFQLLTALSWISTCILSFLAIPLIVLGVYELITYARLGKSRTEQDMLRGRAKTLAILDICSILLLNLPSMVCGILQLAFHNQFDE